MHPGHSPADNADLPPKVLAAWQAYRDALEAHEMGHADRQVANAEALEQIYKDAGPMANCSDLGEGQIAADAGCSGDLQVATNALHRTSFAPSSPNAAQKEDQPLRGVLRRRAISHGHTTLLFQSSRRALTPSPKCSGDLQVATNALHRTSFAASSPNAAQKEDQLYLSWPGVSWLNAQCAAMPMA